MIENPYKRNAPLPKKVNKVPWFPRLCSLRTIIVGILLLLAILTWILHVRGDYTAGDVNSISTGKLRGKGKADSLENSKRNGKQKQEVSKEEVPESEEPIINKWRELAKLPPSPKPSVSPTTTPTTDRHRQTTLAGKKSAQSSDIAMAELEEIRQHREAALKHAALREEHSVSITTTQSPIQVQRTTHHDAPLPAEKQHDDDDVKEEEGEPQQQVKLITGKAKRTNNAAADRVDNNIDKIIPPVARVTPHVVMSTGLNTHTLSLKTRSNTFVNVPSLLTPTLNPLSQYIISTLPRTCSQFQNCSHRNRTR